MVAERITDKRFEVLSAEYEREQAELETTITELQTEVDSFADSAERAANFLNLTRRYEDYTELTAPMLHEFIKKIVVCERAEKNKVYTTQKVKIYLNFIEDYAPPIAPAAFSVDEPDPEEAERERKRKYHSDYYHRRKENDGKPLTPEETPAPRSKSPPMKRQGVNTGRIITAIINANISARKRGRNAKLKLPKPKRRRHKSKPHSTTAQGGSRKKVSRLFNTHKYKKMNGGHHNVKQKNP